MEIPIVYTPEEAAKAMGLGRTRLYQELNSGRLQAKKVGRRTLIPRTSVESWLANLASYSDANTSQSRLNDTKKKA